MENIMKFLFILLMFYEAHGSEILMITLGGTKSHKIPFIEIGKLLRKNDHQMTLVSGFPGKDTHGIKDVSPKKVVEYIEKYSNRDLLGSRMKGHMPIPILDAMRYPLEVCDAFYEDLATKSLMNNTYDLLIIDGAYPECALGLVHLFKKPFIYLNTVAFYTGSIERAGSPLIYSITPAFTTSFTEKMSFLERLYNTSWHLFLSFFHWIMTTMLHSRLKKHIDKNILHPYALSKEVNFILQNGSPILTYPRPFLSNVAEIACVHCKASAPLPKELEDFIGSSNKTDGFVYVSMGSSVNTVRMPTKLKKMFIEVFSRLPYSFIWKWDADERVLKNLPKNIKTGKWFPQQDILGHKKLKAFITHGGLLSMFESVYHGAPILTLPVFCDHDANSAKAVFDKYAIKLDLETINAASLERNILKLINDQSYKKAAMERRKFLLDHYITPTENALFWIEYILRYNGAEHLKSHARHLSFASYYSLDVYFLYILLIFSVIRLCNWHRKVKILVQIKYDKDK